MRIEVSRDQDGGWVGEAPELPGVRVQGATETEAHELAEVMALRVIADLIEFREPVPAEVRNLFAAHTGLTLGRAIRHFAGHVLTGSLIFIIIAIPAVLLHLLVYALEKLVRTSAVPTDLFLLTGLKLVEYVIFTIDALTFIAYLIISAYRFIQEM